jgi:hypothetical protein
MGNTVADFKIGRYDNFRDRQKVTLTSTDTGKYWLLNPPTPEDWKLSTGSLQRCVDETHPEFFQLMRARSKKNNVYLGRSRDFGGPFAIERASVSPPLRVSYKGKFGGSTLKGYEGYLPPSTMYNTAMTRVYNNIFPSISTSLGTSRHGLEALGSTAVAKSIPDIPRFSLFRFVGELATGLPKIPLKALAGKKEVSAVGDEYLNVQFGIMPTISDTQRLIDALMNPTLRSVVEQSLTNEHRVRKVVDKGTTSTTRALTSGEMASSNGLTGQSGTLTVTTEYKVWSSITFIDYQVNEMNRLLNDLDEKLGGLGAVPTAIDLWNLVPWSWFLDWFTNFNHVITNLSYLGREGLAIRRGYLMAHYTTREVHQKKGLILGQPFLTTGEILTERKYRVRASPFGFGYTWKDFDPFQLSILGALGVSRLRF